MPRKQASKTAAVKSATKPVKAKAAAPAKPAGKKPSAVAAKPLSNAAPATKAACKKTAAPVAARPVAKAVKAESTKVTLAAPVAHHSSPLDTRVISRAIALLKGCGCTYEVVDAKGSRYTNRVEAAEGSCRKRVNRFASTGYIARLRAMKVGDSIKFDTRKYAPTAARSFRGAVSGSGILAFGTGNFMTSLNGHFVEARRVG